MNLLIVFVILFVLLISEMGNSHPVDDVWIRLGAIGITTFLVPMLAAFQTIVVTRRLKSQQIESDHIPRMLNRLTACHSAVWLAASLAIVYSFQWQKIVRGNWQLDRWPLLDEVLIMAPVLLSLIASWAIFFDIQTVFADKTSAINRLKERVRFVALRVRVYLAIFLVPTLVAIAARDVLDSHIAWSQKWLVASMIIGIPVLLAVFPFLVLLVWRTTRIQDEETRNTIQEVVQQHQIRVSGVRIWKTSRQIVNAVVAGVFPYFRVILISDGLIQHFSDSELKAIIRHEAGHIRRWHLPSRMLFILLPVTLLVIAEWLGYDPVGPLNSVAVLCHVPESWVFPILTVLYCVYLFIVLAWLSKRMEFDADQYAVTLQSDDSHAAPQVCPEAAEDMTNALLQFAELVPDQVDRKSFWHPTLRQRLIRIEQLKKSPHRLDRHSENFVYHQFLLVVAIIVLTTLTVILGSLMSHPAGL